MKGAVADDVALTRGVVRRRAVQLRRRAGGAAGVDRGLNLDLGIRYDWIEQAAQDWQAF
jgi:hypothetical protein